VARAVELSGAACSARVGDGRRRRPLSKGGDASDGSLRLTAG
jgi:hypothetical protein